MPSADKLEDIRVGVTGLRSLIEFRNCRSFHRHFNKVVHVPREVRLAYAIVPDKEIPSAARQTVVFTLKGCTSRVVPIAQAPVSRPMFYVRECQIYWSGISIAFGIIQLPLSYDSCF